MIKAILVLFLSGLLLPVGTKPQPHKVMVHVLSSNEDGEVVAEMVRPPLFALKVENGTPPGAGIEECTQSDEDRTSDAGPSYQVVALKCSGGTLVLVGVDLGPQ